MEQNRNDCVPEVTVFSIDRYNSEKQPRRFTVKQSEFCRRYTYSNIYGITDQTLRNSETFYNLNFPEWGSWMDLEGCPETLPEDQCSVFVKRVRECYCIEPSDQNRFVVLGAKCGIAPAITSYACDFAEKC